MAAKKVSAGLTGNVDNLEFELKESEIQIEQKQIEQKHLEAHQIFVKLFGEDIDDSKLSNLDFSKAENLTKIANEIKFEDTIDYQKAELTVNRLDLEQKIIRAQFLPSLDFTYSAGRLTPSEESPIRFNESRYALLLTIPLFTGFDTHYKIKSAMAATQSAEKNKQQKINDFQSEFNILKTKMTETSSLLKINERKLINSQKYFELTLSEYKRGIKNSPDLVSATERLYSSKKRSFELLKDLELLNVKIENLRYTKN